MKTRYGNDNQYAAPMWGTVLGSLVMVWLYAGHEFLRDRMSNDALATTIWVSGTAAWYALTYLALRARNAASRRSGERVAGRTWIALPDAFPRRPAPPTP